MLEEITYPIGGWTVFAYEGNKVQKNKVPATLDGKVLLKTLIHSLNDQNDTLVTLGGLRLIK